MKAEEIEQRFEAFCSARELFDGASPLVVAVSGGADSCALLALLCETAVVPRDRILVAHFDHRLRGEDDARADLRAVESLCARYGVPLETEAWNAPVAKEAAAREARYAFLADVAAKHGAGVVVTGHTADDQVETVVMHALRGAGLYGLAGMAVSSWWPFVSQDGPRLVRPLLGVSRDETHAYCAARAIAFSVDASNADHRFLRNRIRGTVLPAVDAAMPEGRTAILALADEARAGIEAIIPVVDALIVDDDAGRVRIARAGLRSLAPALVAHAYRRALLRLLGDAREFEQRHYAILARAHAGRTGSTFEMPRGVVATVEYDAVVLSIGVLPRAVIDGTVEHALPFIGVLGGWRIEVLASGDGDGPHVLALPDGAVVRGRRAGDRIQPRGMRGHKKLQDYYVDRKVPRRERDAAPVIAAGGDVLWTTFGSAQPRIGGRLYAVRGTRAG
jgi:tRNA(Ile)-lysidine synthase